MNIYTKKSFGSAQAKQNFLWRKILIGIVALVLLVGFLNIFQEQMRNYFYFISYPITRTFWESGNNSSNFFESFLRNRDLKKENNNLKEENQKLLFKISTLQDFLRENQAMKEISQNTEADSFRMVLAQTIGLDIFNDFILINKGSDDGILENMPVISSQKIIYGKVFKTYKNFSQVMLISSKNSVLDVKIQDDDPNKVPIYGAIKGSGNLSLYLDTVSFESEIQEGDILITSALEGIFPKDVLVGKIISKNKNDLKPFQTAEVQPFFDVKNIDNLFVITDYMQKK